MLQALDSRVLFSATLTDGELVVRGTSSADHIVVEIQAQTGGLVIDVNGHRDLFLRKDVDRITIRGGSESDGIDASHSPIPVVLYGGSGNDKLIGGPAGDRLLGGNGDDDLRGGAGRDRLEGGEGNDHLDGGKANDSLFGAAGNDQLFGGDQCDYLDGGDGNDKLDVGWTPPDPIARHPETLLGGNGNDTLNGINNSFGDEIDGGAGRDTSYYETPVGNVPNGKRDLIYGIEKQIVFTV